MTIYKIKDPFVQQFQMRVVSATRLLRVTQIQSPLWSSP
jgi:hypothetical protein